MKSTAWPDRSIARQINPVAANLPPIGLVDTPWPPRWCGKTIPAFDELRRITFQLLPPRADMGHQASARPFGTHIWESGRLTVGSQCDGASLMVVPKAGTAPP